MKREAQQRTLTDIGFRLAALRQFLRDRNFRLAEDERNSVLDEISRLVELRKIVQDEIPED